MQVIKDNKSLVNAIAHLENVQKSEANLLKQHFEFTIQSLNPINIVKEKIKETFSSPTLKSEIIKGSLTLATGLLTNNLIMGSNGNFAQKIVASLVQTGLSKLPLIDPQSIKKSGFSFLQNVLAKMKIGPSK